MNTHLCFAFIPGIQNQELHFNEPWFHGKLKGGRAAAEALLRGVKYDICIYDVNDVFT